MLEELPITYMHIFPYSKRPNTPAALMQGQVPDQIKRERFNELKRIHIAKKSGYMKDHLARTLEIIIEERCREDAVIGTASNYLKVRVPSENHIKKSCVSVRITGIEDDVLTGTPIENP